MSHTVRNILHVIILCVQGLIAFGVALCVYMIFVLMEYTGGLTAFIGIAIFQPILGSIVAAISIFVCLIVGLPLRLVSTVRDWWMRYFILSPFLAFGGIVLLIISLLPAFSEVRVYTNELGESISRTGPNITMAVCGWFITIFGILHTFPPLAMMNWLQNLFVKRRSINH